MSSRIDQRIRELCFKILRDRAAEKQQALAMPSAQPGRCQKSVQPDGRPFWSFTWMLPQTIVSQTHNAAIEQASQNPEPDQEPRQA